MGIIPNGQGTDPGYQFPMEGWSKEAKRERDTTRGQHGAKHNPTYVGYITTWDHRKGQYINGMSTFMFNKR